ncbi:hypothetical protein EOM39_02175 [Candidatus Gracilibacteria bacterium]|nr:hypothetical protein [Candidatus Gracilibacteria bacterium]
MKLKFSKNDFLTFKNLQNIKEYPLDIEKRLIEKTIRYIRLIKWIPGIQMIAVGNSVAMNSANNNSDIDLFIVSSKNRLWTVRILITFIFQILGVRKNNKNHKKRFCLSFFCTTNALNFEKIAIKNDIYLYYWIIYLKPILDYNSTYSTFIEENKKWCNFEDYNSILEGNKNSIFYKKDTLKYNCKILNLLEKLLKYIFISKTKKSFMKLGNPFGVIINDDMLKFHDKDIRKEVRDKVIQKLEY